MERISTIDLTPTWKQAARIYIAGLEDGTPEGKQNAREGILEMAELLDALVAEQREQREELL